MSKPPSPEQEEKLVDGPDFEELLASCQDFPSGQDILLNMKARVRKRQRERKLKRILND